MHIVKDALERTISLEDPPQRIISLVPSVTESLAVMGCTRSLIAATVFCTRPKGITKSLPKIGGTKNLNLKLITELEPDLVIANKEENRQEDIETLIKMGIQVYVGYPRTVKEATHELKNLATLVGKQNSAASIINEINSKISEQETLNKTRSPIRIFCPIWRDPYMAVSGETFAGDLLRTAGGINVFERHPTNARYPQVTLDEIRAAEPDVILLPDEPYRFRTRHRDDFLAIRDIPAAKNEHVFLIEGSLITWHGPQIPQGLTKIGRLLDSVRSSQKLVPSDLPRNLQFYPKRQEIVVPRNSDH